MIRKATHDDAEGILACLGEAFEPYRAKYTPDAFLDTVLTPATLERRLADMTVLVAVGEDGVVAGTISCVVGDGREGHIRGMAVRSSSQGRGLAHELLTSAESELSRRGCARVTLDTTEPLQRAIRFYEKHGYRASGGVTDFFGMQLFEYAKTLSSDLEIVSIRVLDMPRERVFQAWTDPARLQRWWGPKGFTNTFHEFDLRPGGAWRFVMHGPDGDDYRNHCIFVEIVEPERLVWRRVTGPIFQVMVTFEEVGARTQIVFRMLFDTAEACERVKVFAFDANEENFDRLESELARTH